MASSLVQQKFGAAAADYAASAVHAKGESLARLVELVAPKSDWRVLDVATGAGHTALAFAPHVANVIASDITDEMLVETAKLAAKRDLTNVETAYTDATKLPFPGDSFDLVTCRLAAHHFPDPASFVSESWRVLKPGGVFALVDNISPDASMLGGVTREEADKTVADYNAYEKLRDPSHSYCLSIPEWSALLQKTGFVDIRPERMDQDIVFKPWTERMRCDPATVARLKSMLDVPRLKSYLRPRMIGEDFVFTLQEAIIVARKQGEAR
jgi:ubiquinone/menaquinone biosynthesis C-methylase UbiE